MGGVYEPLSFAGPEPDLTNATVRIYESHIKSLREWAHRRAQDGRPITPQELVDQINVRFPEAPDA